VILDEDRNVATHLASIIARLFGATGLTAAKLPQSNPLMVGSP
jgi:hypothetical protein